jgi:prolyl-tRNA synthetase
MGIIVEKFHDDRGIIWPASVAPFQVHLVGITKNDPELIELAENVYHKLEKAGVAVLFDDRDIAPGAKFADADLIGIPVRLVVSAKTGDKIEWKLRSEKDAELVSLEEVIKRLKNN